MPYRPCLYSVAIALWGLMQERMVKVLTKSTDVEVTERGSAYVRPTLFDATPLSVICVSSNAMFSQYYARSHSPNCIHKESSKVWDVKF